MNKSEIIAQALQVLENDHTYQNDMFTSTTLVKDYFRLKLASLKVEHFYVAFLTSQYQLIECEVLGMGCIDHANISVRRVAQRALELNASAIVLSHNHPSGSLEPSEADIKITKKLSKALHIFNINILDHIIVGDGAVSLRELGTNW